ncbi:MAG: outer membrane protein OmpA-like peptidoglycan-associated protein [Arenicella sp.]|jgi:outer membrane protein OmpA-like peptidoglycan-associated protein
MKKLSLIAIIFALNILSPAAVSAQNVKWNTFRGNTQHKKGDFDKALFYYKKALQKKAGYYKANKGVGRIYLYNLQLFDSASVYLSKVMVSEKSDSNYYDIYDWANCLRLNENPSEAIKYYSLFHEGYILQKNIDDPILKELVAENASFCRNAALNMNKPYGDITVNNMDFMINSRESEYTPVIMDKDSSIMFNARYKDLKNERQFSDYQYMENVYYFDLSESEASTFDESLGQGNHHAVVGRNFGSDTMVLFFQNKLWIGSIFEKRLNQKKPLPQILSAFYFQPHGVFSKDHKRFIFSAMKTAKDNLDLYQSTKNENGEWSIPEKIKGNVNTNKKEDSPYLAEGDSTLYFSSKGHNSTGGYDIFKSTLIDGEWTNIEALPYPINSPGDDIYYTLSHDETYGYLSSNRLGGFGMMDIYNVRLITVPTFDCPNFENLDLTAESSSADSVDFIGFNLEKDYFIGDTALLDAGISHVRNSTFSHHFWMLNDSILTIDNPIYSLPLTEAGRYIIGLQIFGDENEKTRSWCHYDTLNVRFKDEITLIDTNELAGNDKPNVNGENIRNDSLSDSMDNGNPTKDLDNINPIYFGFDKSNISDEAAKELDLLVLYLKRFTNEKIMIAGHTDAMGSTEYNKILAQRRIEAAVRYIIKRGISKDRILETLNQGESEPAKPNTLPNGDDNFNGRKLNRRVEFSAVK